MEKLIYHRQTGQFYAEKQFEQRKLHFLYRTPLGRLLLNGLVCRRWFSALAALPNRTKASVRKISAFAAAYHINLSEYEQREYRSFDDFFTRKIRPDCRPIAMSPAALISPCDGKLTVSPISPDLLLRIKGTCYSLPALLGSRAPYAEEYAGGLCLLLRLTVDDCHRFCCIDDADISDTWEIPGRLHTVGHYSDRRYKVLKENHRFGTRLNTAHFGAVIELDVGALLIGRVHLHPLSRFARGEERGYFSYGGSTIILLLPPDRAEIAADIMEQSRAGTETKVHMGECIGRRLNFSDT